MLSRNNASAAGRPRTCPPRTHKARERPPLCVVVTHSRYTCTHNHTPFLTIRLTHCNPEGGRLLLLEGCYNCADRMRERHWVVAPTPLNQVVLDVVAKKRPAHAPDGGAKTSSHPLRLLLMRQQLCKSMSRTRLGPHSHPLDSWYFMGTWRGCQLPLPPTPPSANSLLRQLSLPPTPFSANSPPDRAVATMLLVLAPDNNGFGVYTPFKLVLP